MNSFDYNSMKLVHIIKYHNVVKFQNGPYRIMPSGVIAFVNDNSLFIRIWQLQGHPYPMNTFLGIPTFSLLFG